MELLLTYIGVGIGIWYGRHTKESVLEACFRTSRVDRRYLVDDIDNTGALSRAGRLEEEKYSQTFRNGKLL